ncbi:MAG: cytochrome b/b6 domain-containing protein [Rudaea sp.]|nr:cytochrome b/b6 domain-containing protein [Rudaea sp.]
MNASTDGTPSVRVWDLPTRLFHWALAVLIALQYATGEFGLLDMDWHYRFGYAILALVAFRILWGFAGSQTSRFADFLRGPAVVLRHMRAYFYKNPQSYVGHNPPGGWSVLAMLACVLVQALSGLFASDEITEQGPFADRVGEKTMRLLTRVHDWNQNVLLALIALHVVAVLLHLLLKHDNLILPMLSGRKPLAGAPALRFVSGWRALLLLGVCAAAVVALAWYAG